MGVKFENPFRSNMFVFLMNPLFIDTHAHLYEDSFKEEWGELSQQIQSSGVFQVYLPNVDTDTIGPLIELTKKNPEFFYPMMGIHPCSVKENYKEELHAAEMAFNNKEVNYVAVGEIGLDYYWDKTYIQEQKDAFRIQASWANELNLPIIIHSRDSMDDLILLLKQLPEVKRKGIFHCFTGTIEQAKEIIDLGYYIGIGGVVTFKNSHLSSILPAIGLERIVLETDAPYLAPVPFRGQKNHSVHLIHIARKMADIFQLSLNELANITNQNAMAVFENKKS